jgi:hypothetical protein
MKHLIDKREPITLQDIDQAIADGRAWRDDEDSDQWGLTARLLAIVEYYHKTVYLS